MPEDIRWKQRFENYVKALQTLSDAVELAQKRALSMLEEQGVIQSFEFTHVRQGDEHPRYPAPHQGNLQPRLSPETVSRITAARVKRDQHHGFRGIFGSISRRIPHGATARHQSPRDRHSLPANAGDNFSGWIGSAFPGQLSGGGYVIKIIWIKGKDTALFWDKKRISCLDCLKKLLSSMCFTSSCIWYN